MKFSLYFLCFNLSFLCLSQIEIGRILAIDGKLYVDSVNIHFEVKQGALIDSSNELIVHGQALLSLNDDGLALIENGRFIISDLSDTLISHELKRFSPYCSNSLYEILSNVSLRKEPCFLFDNIDVDEGTFLTCSNKLPFFAYYPHNGVDLVSLGKVYKPRMFVNISSEAINPALKAYDLFNNTLFKIPLSSNYVGEVDLSDKEVLKNSVIVLELTDDKGHGLKYATSFGTPDTSTLNFIEKHKKTVYDELWYAIKLYEQGCTLEAISAVYRAKKMLKTQNHFILDAFLEEWYNCMPLSVMREPIIYLYGEVDSVNVSVDLKGKMKFSYPDYNLGWDFRVRKDGLLKSLIDSSNHRYLFWEGEIQSHKLIEDYKTGFCVQSDTAVSFLKNKLSVLGFNEFEINDFVVFWVPYLKKNQLNFIRFEIDDSCDEFAKMEINPKPDALRRVYMLYKPLAEEEVFIPQQFNPFKRGGFTVIEWGGLELIDLKKGVMQNDLK